MGKYLIGIDAGTTNIKAVLFDAGGGQLCEASEENRVVTYNLSWAEQDMDELWEHLAACVRRLMTLSGAAPEDIMAVGLSAQGEGLWCLDAQGAPVRRAILWNDGRAAGLVAKLKADTELYNEIKLQTGSYIKPGSTLTQIKWYKENEPELFAKTRTIFTCKDFLRYRMTGQLNWEMTDASCSCLDLVARAYPLDLFARLGIPEAAGKLPPLISGTDCGGWLTETAAFALGLRPGTPVSGGMIDVVATAVGAGALETYSVCTILGTTGMNLTVTEEYVPDLAFNGWECHMESGKWVKGMGMMSAMPNQNWALQELFGVREFTPEVFAQIDAELPSMRPGEGGLLYLPHIDPSGERAPFFDPTAAAQLMGIKTTTTRGQILHAVVEGVCLGLRSCLENIPNVHPILLSGGGARGLTWPKILADCTGRDVLICQSTELAAKGAALSAALMIGLYPSCAEAKEFFRIRDTVRADPARTRQYDRIYPMYRRAQELAGEFWTWRDKFLRGEDHD